MFKLQYQYRAEFWEWCRQNNILCEYMGTENGGGKYSFKAYDTWYIGNEQDRVWAMLKWC